MGFYQTKHGGWGCRYPTLVSSSFPHEGRELANSNLLSLPHRGREIHNSSLPSYPSYLRERWNAEKSTGDVHSPGHKLTKRLRLNHRTVACFPSPPHYTTKDLFTTVPLTQYIMSAFE